MIKYEDQPNGVLLAAGVDDAFLVKPCGRCGHRWSEHHEEYDVADPYDGLPGTIRWCTGGSCQCFGWSPDGYPMYGRMAA